MKWTPPRVTAILAALLAASNAGAQALPGTGLWDDRGTTAEAAAEMVEGLHALLDRELAASPDRRGRRWSRDVSSVEAYERSIAPNRARLSRIIGAVDPRAEAPLMHLEGSVGAPAMRAEGPSCRAFAVGWEVYPGVRAEGLLLEPLGLVAADVVMLPDGVHPPEAFAGLTEELPPEARIALRLAGSGCRVVVPTLLNRTSTFSGNPEVRMTNLSHREWIWRQAFEVGRHPIGFEVDAVRAAVDWCRQTAPDRPLGVAGTGEGGLIALYAAALDPRIDAAWVAGAFGGMEETPLQPIDRDVWSLLDEFGDAELASLIAPRGLVIEPSAGPEIDGPPPPVNGRSDAASGRLSADLRDGTARAIERLESFGLPEAWMPTLIPDGAEGPAPLNSGDRGRRAFLARLLDQAPSEFGTPPMTFDHVEPLRDTVARQGRWVRALQDHTQGLLRTSELRRSHRWDAADATSPETWAASLPPFREAFRDVVIGHMPPAELPMEPRSVRIAETEGFLAYAVEIPVWEGAPASGVLLLPKDLEDGERRPVVVCQHGLEGTPEPIVTPGVESPYNSYGARLAGLGYIVYAPQNPYIGVDRFRTLQRKAHPLGASLFAIIVRQHERTLQWLSSLPHVDPARIAFYGLSYGGKTAMRVPALLDGYCLSICSADFNEWVVKCTNLDRPLSYLYTIEYDMYEWDLASGFNYAEMANLIAPRPFMVERGHDDGVAPDEWVAFEYAKVRRRYDQLGIGDRSAITFFNGGHLIKGEETFRFLARHLDWPRGLEPPASD